MKFLRTVVTAVAVVASLSCVHAGIFFANPDLSSEDNVLFTVRNTSAINAGYNSLFSLNLKSNNYEHDSDLLTYYPEQMEFISGGTFLQVRNRYGTVRYDVQKKIFAWTKQNWKTQKDFVLKDNSNASTYAVSPNGKWFCYVEKTSTISGRVIIEDASSGARLVVVEDFSLSSGSYGKVPVEWANDSSALFYEKNGSIYFLSPEPFFRGIEADEENRKIGTGKIASICAADRYIFYINGDCVYRINTKELYTLGLYSDIIGTGTSIGRLADVFLPQSDYFSVSPDVASLVVVRGGKTVAVYSLPKSGSNFLPITCYRPYVNSAGSIVDSKVIWSDKSELSIWFELMSYELGTPISVVNKIAGQTISPVLNTASYVSPIISPCKKYALVVDEDSLYVCDTVNWNRLHKFSGEKIVGAVWASSDEVYIGGECTLSKWQLSVDKVEVIALSSVSSGRWNYNVATATTNGKQYIYNKNTRSWGVSSTGNYVDATVQNGRYRVYVGEASNPKYDNALFFRTLSNNPETRAIFAESVVRVREMPSSKKVALMFDAYDSSDGLPKILSVLHKYKLRSTFFLNGEFIKRYPIETKQISQSGNECASMFFSVSNLTDSNFNMSEPFVRRGLARTEDLFYQATNKELALLWHAPFYNATPAIKNAAHNAGYFYVEPTFLPPDNVTLEQAASGYRYESSAHIISAIVEILNRNNGGCIPVSVGILQGTRADYLYNHIELLINALLDAGFEIVLASSLR